MNRFGRNSALGTLRRAGSLIALLSIVSISLVGCMNPKGGSGDIRELSLKDKSYAVPASFRLTVTAPRKIDDSEIYCPEPSPDAMAVAAESFGASLATSSVSAGVSGGITQAAIPLFARSQAIQAVRDTTTAACLAYQNGVLSRFGYYMAMAAYPDLLLGTMAIEGITDRPLHMPAGVSAGAPGMTVDVKKTEGADDTNNNQATSSVSAQAAVFQAGLASPGARVDVTENEIREIRILLESLAKSGGVISSACFMHLADIEANRGLVHEKLTKACETIVEGFPAYLAAEAKTKADLSAAVASLEKMLATVQADITELKSD